MLLGGVMACEDSQRSCLKCITNFPVLSYSLLYSNICTYQFAYQKSQQYSLLILQVHKSVYQFYWGEEKWGGRVEVARGRKAGNENRRYISIRESIWSKKCPLVCHVWEIRPSSFICSVYFNWATRSRVAVSTQHISLYFQQTTNERKRKKRRKQVKENDT